jgi:hypothetical protein
LHDAVTGEQLGIPSVSVMTEAFVNAAELMASTLGAEGYRFAVIEHPIASASTRQLAERAERVADVCVDVLTGQAIAGRT